MAYNSINAVAPSNVIGSMPRASMPRLIRQPPDLILHRGDHLRERNRISGRLFEVASGFLKSYVTDFEGREHVTQFHFPGDIIGLDSLGHAHHLASTIALDTCGIRRLKSDMHLGGKLSTEESAALTRALSRELYTLHSLASNHSAKERLAAFLVAYSERMAELGLSKDELQLPMNRAEIGNYLRLTPSTISRLFTWFTKEGIIHARGAAVTVLDGMRLHAECRDLRVL